MKALKTIKATMFALMLGFCALHAMPAQAQNEIERVRLTVGKTFTPTTATLVFRLENKSNSDITNIRVEGNIGDFFGNKYKLNSRFGVATVKVLNPRTMKRQVVWRNFSLKPREDATLTLTVTLPPGSSGKTIASGFTATFKTTGGGFLAKTPVAVKVP
jgi:hypothetical protein